MLLQTRREHPDAFRPRYQLMLMACYRHRRGGGHRLSILAPWIVNLLYGAKYAPAANVLRLVAWVGVFSNIGSHEMSLFRRRTAERDQYISLITAIATIGLSVLLIPLLGLFGAACACIGSFVIESMAATFAVPGTRPFLKLYFGSFRTLWQYGHNFIRNRRDRKDGGAHEG